MLSSKYASAQGKTFYRLLGQIKPSTSSFRPFSTSLRESYSNIIVTKHDPPSPIKDGHLSVGLIELNRPKALNSLSDALFDDLIHATTSLNEMDDIGSIVITGKGKAFAAGADIEEMSERNFAYAYKKVRKL